MISHKPLTLCVILALATLARAEQPNILMIVSDDQRPDAIGALGHPDLLTPALDSLAQRGTLFTRAYCMGSNSGAVCAPSRAMLMSGRSYFTLEGNVFRQEMDIPLLPEVLATNGYETFATGKWHNGRTWFNRCFERGGAVFFGGMGNHRGIKVVDKSDGSLTEPEQISGFSSEVFADATIDFLNSRDQERPFFAYLSFTAPHDPRTPPEDMQDIYDPAEITLPENYMPVHPFDNGEMVIRDERLEAWPRSPEAIQRHLAEYYAMISHMDREIGRVLASLDALGLTENTIVVFCSDHGLAIGSHGLLGKQNMYEHSIGAPMIIAGPGIDAWVESGALVYLHDLFPTICELIEADVPEGLHATSFASALTGDLNAGRDSIFCAYRGLHRSIFDGRYKLIRYPRINRTQLFDLELDTSELNDLSSDPEHQDAVMRLLIALTQAQERAGDSLPLTSAEVESDVFDAEAAERNR